MTVNTPHLVTECTVSYGKFATKFAISLCPVVANTTGLIGQTAPMAHPPISARAQVGASGLQIYMQLLLQIRKVNYST